MNARIIARLYPALILILCAAKAPAQSLISPHIVKDIYTGAASSIEEDRNIAASGRNVFFVARDATHNYELWVTDGTAKGMRMLTDAPGSGFSELVPGKDGIIFFTHSDGFHGTELWTSDGTLFGTRMVIDLYPGPENGVQEELIRVGDRIVFMSKNTPKTVIYSTDGSANGTQAIASFDKLPRYLGVTDRWLYFTVSTGDMQLWRTDGTAMGTVYIMVLRSTSPAVRTEDTLTTIGQRAFFSTGYNQLWQTDGTPEGTYWINSSYDPIPMVGFKGKLYYLKSKSTWKGNLFLYSHDPVSGKDVEIVELPDAPINSQVPILLGLEKHFVVMTETHLWRSDGSVQGTTITTTMYPCILNAYPAYHTKVKATVNLWLFSGGETPNLFDFWLTDGTEAGTRRLGPTGLRSDAEPRRLVKAGDNLYYTGYADGAGMELWSMPLSQLDGAADAWRQYP